MPSQKCSQKRRKASPRRCLSLLALFFTISTTRVDQATCFQSNPLPSLQRLSTVHPGKATFLKEKESTDDDEHANSNFLKQEPAPCFQELSRKAVAASLAMAISILAANLPVKAIDDISVLTTPTTTTTTTTTTGGMSAGRYWSIMANNHDADAEEMKIRANEALLDHAVGTINTMYYDNSGGAYFTPRDFYNKWREYRDEMRLSQSSETSRATNKFPSLASRQGAVEGLRYLVSTLNDPYSKYLTREELWQELHSRNDGFLGIGALVEPPDRSDQFFARSSAPTLAKVVRDDNDPNKSPLQNMFQTKAGSSGVVGVGVHHHHHHKRKLDAQLSAMRVQNLPVVTAVVPDSPAERAGVTVADRIVAVGEYSFLGQARIEVSRNFQNFVSGENYFGHSDVTVAKPVFRSLVVANNNNEPSTTTTSDRDREVVIGYRQTRVRLPTKSLEEEYQTASATTTTTPSQLQQKEQQKSVRPYRPAPETQYALASAHTGTSSGGMVQTVALPEALTTPPPTKGGNSIVHWELISEQSTPSIFQRNLPSSVSSLEEASNNVHFGSPESTSTSPTSNSQKVGYIRLTRFSRASTAGYIDAIQSLEEVGATSFIIDVRNNYGGIIQEAMLTASTLIRDPHAVLCYTLNSRGGFTPHDVEEYVVDKRYPGYLLSKEPQWVTWKQVQHENPDLFEEDGSNWAPPSSFASLHEQTAKRGIHRVSSYSDDDHDGNHNALSGSPSSSLLWNTAAGPKLMNNHNEQWLAQRNLVILINEGTASSAEVFASSLHDNGRTLALIGSKTYGKGLIQHTFPMPDGGGLRLTVAEYLTPALHHVTNIGNARFDPVTGEQVGGGIRPDVSCDSRQGIPSNIGADLCVGLALDVLEEASDYPAPEHQASPTPPHHQQPQRHPQVPSQDWMQQKSLFVRDTGSSVGSSSSLSASSSISPSKDPERPVDDKGMEDEFLPGP